MVGSSSAWAADTWEETTLAGLTSSDVFVIVGTNSSGSYAMTNNNGTSSAPGASEVTIADGKITSTVADNMKWNISGNAEDGYVFYPNGDSEKWLYCTNTNNGVRVGTNSNKTFKITDSYPYNTATSRYVGIYNSQDWRCYTSINSNISNQSFTFYKKVSSGGGKTDSDLALTGAPIELTFDLYNNSAAQVVNYTTSSTGAVTVSESDYVTTVVDAENKTITVTPKTLTTPSAQTITVSQAEDATYNSGSATFTVTITDSDPNKPGSLANPYTVAQARAAIDAGTGITGVYATGIVSQIVTAYNPSYGNISYNISTDGLTTSDQLQAYRGKNNNGEDFTSADDVKVGDIVVVKGNLKKYSSTYEFDEGNWLVSRVRKADPKLAAVSATIDNMDATTSVAANTLYTVTSDGEISFSSDKEDVANVVAGTLYAYKPGTAKITVSVAETAAYAAGNVDITVTVTSKAAKDPEGPAAGSTYSLVTDAATLNAGDKLLFVDEGDGETGVAMSTTQNSNNRGEVDVTISEHTISTVPTTAQVITLEGTSEGWYFNVGDGYLYAASSSNNYLKTEAEKDDNAKATIAIADNVATIVFQGTNSHNNLRYNGLSGLFSCYASTSTLAKPSIYRQNVASTFDITIDSKGDGWRTIVTAVNATLPSGLKAYIAKADESDKVTLTEVASLKANNAYILYGAAGDYTLTVTDSPADPAGNELRVSTDADGNGAFVLAKKSGVVGFYKWTGGSLGAGRVILPASAIPDASARDFIGLGDATAISNVTVKTKSDNSYYNLAGQRVAQPQKGLYIVNGKKVIIK